MKKEQFTQLKQETDENKSISQLIKEGKIIFSDNNEKCILCEDVPFGSCEFTESGKSAIYKVAIKDIIKIHCYFYYQNLSVLNPIIMKKNYVVEHKGRRQFDKISAAQLKELMKNKVVTKNDFVFYHFDWGKKILVKAYNSSVPPTPNETVKAFKRAVNDYKDLYGKSPLKPKKPKPKTEEKGAE